MKIKYSIKPFTLKVGDKVIPRSKSTGNYGFEDCHYAKGKVKYYTIDDLDYSTEEHKHCVRCHSQRHEYELFTKADLIPYVEER